MIEKLYLEIPSEKHENSYNEMMMDWEISKEHIYPGIIRRNGLSYKEWLEKVKIYSKDETCPKQYVPSDTFFLVNENKEVLGAISIRHYLNERLIKFAGHIGYGIRPRERRKGYGKYILSLALNKCKEMGIREILITCDRENIASAKTIIANCGVLENELVEEYGNVVQRYWINIK